VQVEVARDLFADGGLHYVEFRLRAGGRDCGPQTGGGPEVEIAHAQLEIPGIVAEWSVDFQIFTEGTRTEFLFAREDEGRRQHADHFVRFAIDQDFAADDGRIGLVTAAPERIGEDHDLVVSRLIFLIGEAASESRLYAKDGKNRGRDDGAAHLLGLSAAGEIEDGGLRDADALET